MLSEISYLIMCWGRFGNAQSVKLTHFFLFVSSTVSVVKLKLFNIYCTELIVNYSTVCKVLPTVSKPYFPIRDHSPHSAFNDTHVNFPDTTMKHFGNRYLQDVYVIFLAIGHESVTAQNNCNVMLSALLLLNFLYFVT